MDNGKYSGSRLAKTAGDCAAESTFEELGIDSLDRLNILFELEGEFDVQIDDEESKTVKDIHEMVAGIEHLLAARAKQASSKAE
jgi:acyl carrier protein